MHVSICEMSMYVSVCASVCEYVCNVFKCVWMYQCMQVLSMNVHVSVCEKENVYECVNESVCEYVTGGYDVKISRNSVG